MAETLVLGAGIVGVCTALSLQSRGHSVVLIDRHEPGQQTSFGNAGIIQAEACEPYPMPLSPRALLSIATGRSNDVHWTVRSLLRQAGALARYARHSLPTAHRRAIDSYRGLIPLACKAHETWIREAGEADTLIRRDGYLELFRTQSGLDQGAAMAERFGAEYGTGFEVLDGAGLRALEPAIHADLPGATHWRDAWTVTDPAALTAAYVTLFQARGGQVLTADAARLQHSGGGWEVQDDQGQAVQGEHAVIAMGPWSPALALRFGLKVPMLFKRGYHQHYAGAALPSRSLADLENGVVLSPMRAGLRICTAADLSARADADPRQLQRGHVAATELLGALEPVQSPVWSGVRPCMPDMLPVVGAIGGQKGLWANFGHGHHGLTLAAVTADILADAVDGNSAWPELSPERLMS